MNPVFASVAGPQILAQDGPLDRAELARGLVQRLNIIGAIHHDDADG